MQSQRTCQSFFNHDVLKSFSFNEFLSIGFPLFSFGNLSNALEEFDGSLKSHRYCEEL